MEMQSSCARNRAVSMVADMRPHYLESLGEQNDCVFFKNWNIRVSSEVDAIFSTWERVGIW